MDEYGLTDERMGRIREAARRVVRDRLPDLADDWRDEDPLQTLAWEMGAGDLGYAEALALLASATIDASGDTAGETDDERIRREREAVQENAPLVCDECPSERGVQTYYDNHSDVEVDLCPSCYHNAERSGADLG